MKTKLTATTARGTFTRTTARAYSHVVVYSDDSVSWHGSEELARRAASTEMGRVEKFYVSLRKMAAKGKGCSQEWLDEQKIDLSKNPVHNVTIYPVDAR